jgi:hypothetical protein
MSDKAWKPMLVERKGIKVVYREKYGSQIEYNCIGLWENSSEYMLTWKDDKKIILQKSNIISIDCKKI